MKADSLGFALPLLIVALIGCSRMPFAPPHAIQASALPALANLQTLSADEAKRDAKGEWLWYDAAAIGIEGKGWAETDRVYSRLPSRAKEMVPESLWGLSDHSAGLAVRFATDASAIAARWTVTSEDLAMPHMPATGVSGLDLYVRDGSKWVWIGAGGPAESRECQAQLVDGLPEGLHEFMLYLPLYNGTQSLEIGIAPKATMARPAARAPERLRPICFYGTSIVQGGCASRPGMAHAAILGRWLGRETINLGFSGCGKMEPEVAELLSEIDAELYVLDALPNMTAEMVAERAEPFVRILRKSRPDTPIVLVESFVEHVRGAFLPETRKQVAECNAQLREIYERLVADGVEGLTYVAAKGLLGDDNEGAVDGVHPTDLGFFRFAQALEPHLRAAMESR